MKFTSIRLILLFVVIHPLLFAPLKKVVSQNFPPLEITIHDSGATQGYYFLAPYASSPPYDYLHPQLILDRFGKVIWYRVFPGSAQTQTTYDFKIQPDERISYYSIARKKFFVMDSTFTDKDSVDAANGFIIDVHDLQFLPNGHYLLLAQETRIMNLSGFHYFGFNHTLPGSANAEVIGVVIQEFDENKNLVWEWKGHDHFGFGDVDPLFLFSPNKVDWTHANAVEQDNDGNILLSCRHFDEITKIDKQTGVIIWRFGGKRNQFTCANDPLIFSGQHDIRRISNGHITLLDNGNYHVPPLARALEYDLNEADKTATLVWDYSYNSSLYSIAVGSHQVLPNGNHLIDFGTTPEGLPWCVLVKPDKSIVMELSYAGSYTSYRAFNYDSLPWALAQPIVDCYKEGNDYFLAAEPGHTQYRWSTGDTSRAIQVTLPGEYWVFVPHGEGFISSRHVVVSDPSQTCLYLPVTPPEAARPFTVKCVPNPVRDQLKIIFDLPERSDISGEMVNLAATFRISIPCSDLAPGKNVISVNLSDLERGIYFLRFIAGQSVITEKIIVE